MKKSVLLLLAVLGMTSTSSFGQLITVGIGSDTKTVGNLSSQGQGLYGLSNNWHWVDGSSTVNLYQTDSTGGYTQFDVDPSVHYAYSANNTSAQTQTYSITFTLPLPITYLAGQQLQVASTLSGSISSDTINPITIGLINPALQQSYVGTVAPGNNAGVDLVTSSLTLTPVNPVFGIYSQAFGPYNSGSTYSNYTVSANASQLNVVTTFTLSPDSSASIDGAFVVTTVAAVPEPSQVIMLLSGFGVLLIATRRRRNA